MASFPLRLNERSTRLRQTVSTYNAYLEINFCWKLFCNIFLEKRLRAHS